MLQRIMMNILIVLITMMGTSSLFAADITGKVLDKETNQPIVGVTVSLIEADHRCSGFS